MRYLSAFQTDADVLTAFNDIFLRGAGYDLDCTYSKGVFYKDIAPPRYKSDLIPQYADVVKDDARELNSFEDGSLQSIVFDPPFLFRKRKSVNNDKISARFSYFDSYESLIGMYCRSLQCFYRKLNRGGYVFFKCQDMTDGKFYCTHKDIIDLALFFGFELKDIAIKVNNTKLQRDAKQQNCVAKVHSYWLVFRKG